MRAKVYFLLRLLPPLAGLAAIVILTLTTYLFRRQRYYIVSDERANHSVQHSIMKTQLLTIPEDIARTIGQREWISRTINDTKRECAAVTEISQEKVGDSDLACKIPDIDPFSSSMMQLIDDVKIPSCLHHKSYGKLVNGKIEFLDPTVISANYRRIVREGDFKAIFGASVPIPSLNTTERITDEFIEVEYLLKNEGKVKEIFAQPILHEHLLSRTAQREPGIPLNILIISIDSLSHANARRKLPEVYKYLKDELGAMTFNGLSIVGDGTTEQLTAMLTGLGELEQYESRRHHDNPKPVDGWTWIYKQLKESGYLTGYSFDWPSFGTWQFRLMGFDNPPTDFYPRPFNMIAERLLKYPDMCLASKTISKVQFDYIRQIFDKFRNQLKFFLTHNAIYSHNSNNEAAKIEPDLLSLLKDLRQNNHLDNTLLIVMGDHGARYGEARSLLQGKLEERLPLFSLTFPPWFLEKYPEISKNIKINTDRLTSWYDVYATFRHMLSYPEVPTNLTHGQSLFTEISSSRSCSQANVADHWCPCLQWESVDEKDSHVKNLALAAVEFINNANLEHELSTKKCLKLSLKSINYALLERPNDKLLSFRQTNDLLPEFHSKARPPEKDHCRYQMQFTTSPNNGTYEATVRYYKEWFIVSKDVSRVNKYGSQSECIARDLPHLRKFCMCKT